MDHGQKAGNDEGARDEVLRLFGGEVGTTCSGEDDGRGDDASQHGERVLETEDKGEEDGHPVVEAEEDGGPVDLPHEGQVGPEEEAIVVVA